MTAKKIGEYGRSSFLKPGWKVKGAKKFRHVRIEPALKLKYDRMYSNNVATREYAWAPSSGMQGDSNCFQLDINDANIDVVDLEEGSVRGVNMSNSSNTQKSGKIKEKEANEGRAKKKKMTGIDVQLLSKWDQLLSKWDQLLDSMLMRSDSTSLRMDHKGCSICEVMIELHSIPGILVDNEFHDFASEFLLQQRRREMSATMRSLEEKLEWLKRMHRRSKQN
ncbi:L10-interacting MYB domain-containing protein [Salix suchowensis]|nr:L10-interacting MYB domain-containing protein [Salix suchowensis]